MVIQVQDLVKVYGPIRAVDGISFEVKKGEVFGMLGPNGAGKTTTTEIIEGLRDADSGSVTVMGMDVRKQREQIKQLIGIQLQAPALLPLLNVEEILKLFTSFYRNSLPVDKLLEMVALTESRKVLSKNLSGGQQQRLSVAMAMVNNPEITFLDEPTTGLDPQARRGLWSVIEELRAQGKTVFLTTHYMDEAERLCDRIAVVDHGKIIALDTPKKLISSNFKESAIEFEMEPVPSGELLGSFPCVTSASVEGFEVILYSADVPKTMGAILDYADKNKGNTELRNLHVRQATLEDVFLKLTGRKIRE
ncbi:MAG: ATP-binding cassette domain-containing protein [Dehalococcoides mccartyi]|jgi:ABC-type multidrug transport system, ATPase component|uniref:ABC transporter n=3 Tax=root TaxID=1 RepID=A0A0V8LY20_9CHLR|nr:ATP-binding cassette domain-containing protein [Dehalococcoides mccartyi]AAW39901.1 ABC transporter, ATP-binding protein [Dehalococcoides mccartyi 195]AII59423.1 ABC transporter [Dehalococcoides mccartyi CG4]AQU03120.1 ABC transporter [Dehalococcoides mccartyi]AQU04437.1 ABC transporter [Dehalococcoides mccartyi]KSV16403.1 ABC transporter [Dehalococcoides mccartyi]